MIGRFHSKFLVFYGVTFLLVILLFQQVTAYGDRSLKAPPKIQGRYVSDQPWPGCLASTRLVLTLYQSGIYLSGNVSIVDQDQETSLVASSKAAHTPELTVSREKPTLTGQWTPQHVMLSGQIPELCNRAQASTAATTPSPIRVQIQGQITNSTKVTFVGQMSVGPHATAIPLRAEREAIAPNTPTH
jgi:hypothetical protein